MWYKIKDNVEYSPDMGFFLKEQIGVSKSNHVYSFHSRLEAYTFRQIHVTKDDNYTLSDKEINKICVEIHTEIFKGKHGEGKLVN